MWDGVGGNVTLIEKESAVENVDKRGKLIELRASKSFKQCRQGNLVCSKSSVINQSLGLGGWANLIDFQYLLNVFNESFCREHRKVIQKAPNDKRLHVFKASLLR